jgi:hypothetical protein
MACLLAEMKASQEETKAEIRTNQEEMKTNQERMEAKREVNNKNFEVLQGTLVSQIDIHKTRTEANQRAMTAKWMHGQKGRRPMLENWRPIERS